MANIKELRQKYPQYSDMSDNEFADKFHNKYYSDIPKNEFYNKIGISQNNTGKEWLKREGNFLKENVINPLIGGLGGFEQGTLNVVPGLLNLPIKGVNALGGNIPEIPRLHLVPESGASQVGELASYLYNPAKLAGKIPEIAKYGQELSKSPMISKMLEKYSNIKKENPFLTKSAEGAVLGGAYSPENTGLGMGLGAGLGAGGHVLGQAIEKFRPTNLFRGNLTPEELKKNLEITEGTQTGLGDVIGSPMLKRFQENYLSKIPGSGINDTMMKTAGTVVDKGHDILNKLLGNHNPEEFEKVLNDTLQDVHKEHKEVKNKLYDKPNKLSKDSNLKLELPNFSKTANKLSDAIEDTNILKYEPEIASILNKLKNYKNPIKNEENLILNQEGKKTYTTKYPYLEEANILAGKLNDLSKQYGASPSPKDRNAANVFSKLGTSLKEDIKSSIKKHGNKELEESFNTAEKNYAKNYSSFLDKDIYKYATGNADTDTLISSFIKTGKSNDRANLITKLIEKLPGDKKNLLGYGYLQRALDENNVINPMKFNTLVGKNALGNKQFKALFPNKELRDEIRNYSSLVSKNTKGLKLMQNPETGQMAMDILPLLSHSSPSLISKLLLAKPIGNWLTSEDTRNKLVRSMINSK